MHYPKSPPPPLSRPRYDIFSWTVHIDRPYGALIILHTGGSVVGVGVEIMVLSNELGGGAAEVIKIQQRGVQWKQGVVVYMMLLAVLLYNTTPIHCTPLRLHPSLMNTQVRTLQRTSTPNLMLSINFDTCVY